MLTLPDDPNAGIPLFVSSFIRIALYTQGHAHYRIEDADGLDITNSVTLHGIHKHMGATPNWAEIELDREGFCGRFCVPAIEIEPSLVFIKVS